MAVVYLVAVIVTEYKVTGFKDLVVNKNVLLQSLYIFPYKLGGFTVCSVAEGIKKLMMGYEINASLYVGYIYIFLTALQLGTISLFFSRRYRERKQILDPIVVSIFTIFLTNSFFGI